MAKQSASQKRRRKHRKAVRRQEEAKRLARDARRQDHAAAVAREIQTEYPQHVALAKELVGSRGATRDASSTTWEVRVKIKNRRDLSPREEHGIRHCADDAFSFQGRTVYCYIVKVKADSPREARHKARATVRARLEHLKRAVRIYFRTKPPIKVA